MVHTWKLTPLLLAVVVTVSACAGENAIRTQDEGLRAVASARSAPAAVPVVVVSQPFFSGDFASWEVYQKTYDLCATLNGAAVPVVAPWEYRVYNPRENPLLGSTVAQVLRDEGIDPENSLHVEMRVVMLGGTGDVVVHGTDTRSARTLQRGEVRLVVRSMYEGVELARVVAPFLEDNLAPEVTSANRTPALSTALRAAGAELAELLRETYSVPTGPPLRARVTFNPTHIFDYTVGDDQPLEHSFRTMDAMDSMARRLPFYQYFDPEISVDAMMVFESSDPGLLVETPGSLAAHGIQPGDYIVAVGGNAAHGPHVLHRPFLTRSTNRVTIQFLRDGRPSQVVVQN